MLERIAAVCALSSQAKGLRGFVVLFARAPSRARTRREMFGKRDRGNRHLIATVGVDLRNVAGYGRRCDTYYGGGKRTGRIACATKTARRYLGNEL